MDTRRSLSRQLADLKHQRQQAIASRDEARRDALTEHNNVKRLARQLSGARDEIDALKRKLDAAAPKPSDELREVRRRLYLADRGYREMTARVSDLQTVNESLYRQLAALRSAQQEATTS